MLSKEQCSNELNMAEQDVLNKIWQMEHDLMVLRNAVHMKIGVDIAQVMNEMATDYIKLLSALSTCDDLKNQATFLL